MFETLSKGFRSARNRLSGLSELTEENIDQALRDVRISLLEADVEFGVTKRFLASVKEAAVGQVVRTRAKGKSKTVKVGPAEQFIKICQDELVRMMEFEGERIVFSKKSRPTGIMMVGLQGAGKTTSSAKLAALLQREHGRKPLLVAADMQRPGAVEQLKVLGERLEIPVFNIPGATPLEICQKAGAYCRKLRRDTIIYDTAGRLAVDEPLMQELGAIKKTTHAENVLLVVDAMIGQDSVKTAKSFHELLGLTGVVLTKLDGDARGGAALSIREVTGAAIKYAGMGEGLDRMEEFRPDGMASRILGMGDVVGLMKDFEQVVDEKEAEKDARRMLQGRFTFDDFLSQIEMIQQMGPLQEIFEKLPMFGDAMPEGMNFDERELSKTKAIVHSMTKDERRDASLFQKHPTRLKRVAKGSGRTDREVADLIQRFTFMRQMMGNIGQQAGMLSKVPGMKQLAMGRQLNKMVSTGGFEGNPMMSGLADQLLEAAVAGGPGLPGMGGASPGTGKRVVTKTKRKNKRKQQRKARRKSRRR